MSSEMLCHAMDAILPSREKLVLIALGDNGGYDGLTDSTPENMGRVACLPPEKVMEVFNSLIHKGVIFRVSAPGCEDSFRFNYGHPAFSLVPEEERYVG